MNCSLTEKLKEDDYADITDDPLLSLSMEVDQVTLELEGEAGRSCDEVNTTLPKQLTQDEPQTGNFLQKSSNLGLPL